MFMPPDEMPPFVHITFSTLSLRMSVDGLAFLQTHILFVHVLTLEWLEFQPEVEHLKLCGLLNVTLKLQRHRLLSCVCH